MKFHKGVVSKAKRLFVPCSPAANTKKNPDGGISFIGSPDFGGKDEAFFDSKGWFDSDCEDDFFSVNGDLTPSRGSTPNYQITSRTAPLSKSVFGDLVHLKTELSPTDGKKKLSELLQESLHVERDDDREQKATNNTEETNGRADDFKTIYEPTTLKSSLVTPRSRANSSSSVSTPNSEIKYKKERARRSSHCCLPSFAHSLSFNERKKPMTPETYSN